MRELSDDANAAIGTFMALFDPDCNAHRELTAGFEEVVSAAVPHSRDCGRKNYNIPNAWFKFYARYQPNKQVNLDIILKNWENLTDEDHPSPIFTGNT